MTSAWFITKTFFLQLFNDSVIFQLHKTKSFIDIFDWTVCSKHLLYYVARKNNPKELSCLLMCVRGNPKELSCLLVCVHGKTYLENAFLPVAVFVCAYPRWHYRCTNAWCPVALYHMVELAQHHVPVSWLPTVCGEEHWLPLFTGSYLGFDSHSHWLMDCDRVYQGTAVWTNVSHLGILLIGELHQLLWMDYLP